MSFRTSPQLSKSRFVAGLQCLKRLYLECYQRDLSDPIDAGQQAIFDAGTSVGELARQRYSNGQLVREQYFEHSQAVRTTSTILSDTSVPALFEAAFTFEKIRIRVDILRRNGQESFDLIEVKSNTGVKPEHIPDVAIQMYVLEGMGIPIRQAYVMHINNTYVYQGGPYDLEELFALQDVTKEARAFVSKTAPENLARMWEVLQEEMEPSVATGSHCTTPYKCPFYSYCHQEGITYPVSELPRASRKFLDELNATGIQDIREIPGDYLGLTDDQQRVRNSVATGRQFVSPELTEKLQEITYPISFLDFETFNPALPAFVGTRPYQAIPFQWSLHIMRRSGQLDHESFLSEGAQDPRLAFVDSLLKNIPPEGTIVTYSGYEQTVMKQLATAIPEFAEGLLALCHRTFDLLKLIRENYYHPDFHGSFAIKSVLPALVPEMSYTDLDIQNGLVAAVGFGRMISLPTPTIEKEKTREALLAYCQRDTEAMVRVFEILWAMGVQSGRSSPALWRSDKL